ncbi:uncharacterized protein LOC131011082 isoform X2 [Salvia miltiorrhiza]|nr:uncharacterized protein LOC131011082 isoform X2 [Salvia miltiorrhiza]XP_057794820.1 uncharacterized protein LOC131011082 isoform X2 [Salvia miltiorrhiza]XP_057794821.1 uncharacterized protein LOC131011082 isoform X2 [Salvia miltiorrhiza]XP_057794822.1 uncharacterized protein LOC131011082 isoform X2 [Salvia miltiorrhiza]XP_057794823.1 uncharacterized protein LOC131011082 isoform X2 [Salvia miltiorrhiza]
MGSAAFADEDESQPSTSNCKSYKLSTTILDGCGAANHHASIPRKLRSAIKKRGRVSVTSPFLTSRKQHRVSTTGDTLRKDGAKKSKLNKKQRRITKDEEEVAETLFALAGMFSDADKADQQIIDDEKPEIKSLATLEEDSCPTLEEETRKIGSKVTLGAVCPSSVVNSTAEEVIYQTLEARQPELLFSSKQAAIPNPSGDQSDLRPGSTSRPLVLMLGMNPSGEEELHLDQVAASGFQHGKNKYKELFPLPNLSATRATSSETHKSCLGSRTLFSTQPRVVENTISTEKHTRVGPESNKLWKRCSAHVYISRLIKVLQISDRKEGMPVKPTQPTTCQGADNQMQRINGRNGDTYFSGIDIVAAEKDSTETQNGILLHKRPIHDQQMASETSAKQGYDFLSLGTGHSGLDTSESANEAGCFLEPSRQYRVPYMQSQNQSTVLCSLPRNGYSASSQSHNSASAAQRVLQLSQYHSSSFAGQQQNTGGGGGLPRLPPDWSNGAVVNYAHSLFPHLHAKYQQLSPSQQQFMVIDSSFRHHNLPLRNGGVIHPQNIAQLQLPCNHRL